MNNVLLNYKDLTTEKLSNLLYSYIDQNEKLIKIILSIDLTELSWSNLVEPFIKLNNNFIDFSYLNMKQFHEDELIREYASTISIKLTQYTIDISMRKDVYKIYQYYYDNQYKLEKSKLTIEQISYFEDIIKMYKKQ